jgi:hypothetical protein
MGWAGHISSLPPIERGGERKKGTTTIPNRRKKEVRGAE